jgi:hypothetical protein
MTSNKYSLVHMMLGSRYYAIIEIKNGFKLTKPFVNCLDLASLLLYDTFPFFLRPPPPGSFAILMAFLVVLLIIIYFLRASTLFLIKSFFV